MADPTLLRAFVEAAETEFLDPALVLLQDKRAFQKNWPDLKPTLSETIRHLRKDPARNAVGVQPASLGCVVLDCDEGDGPDAAAGMVRERFGNVVVCVTRSSSGRADRGHVWVRCRNPETVGNWKFRLEDESGIDTVDGDLRSSGGQVRLTDDALRKLTEALPTIDDFESATMAAFQQMRTSTAIEVDVDFDRTDGRDVNDDDLAQIADRLDGPDGTGPRHAHLLAIVADLKRSGVSFDAALELLSDHAPHWPDEHGDDDGKFAGDELERHVGLAWSKLPPHVPAEDDFDDDLETADATTAIVARASREVGPTYHRGLTIRSNRAVDDYKNAKAGIFGQGLRPAYNELKQSVSFTGALNWDESYGRDLSEHTTRMVRDLLIEAYQGVDFQPAKEHVYEAILSLSYENKFHPVIDYLDGLEWDGKPRCHDLFTLGFPCVDDPRYLSECGVRFMISAVARARAPGCKVDTMPVVCSAQGSLKSTGVRVLFGDDWSSDAAIPDLKSKEAAMLLRGTWCYEYAELAGMGNQDIATLKAFLSRAVDTYRAVYGKTPEGHPRRCVFFGTVNETGYLRDPTGGRRFWPMEMAEGSRVDIEWIAANRDQLWAEADARFASGERWWLEDEAWELATERAAAETVEDPWADMIRAHLVDRLAEPNFDDEPVPSETRIATTELLQAVGCGGGRARQVESKRIRRIMQHEVGGWRYKKALRIGDKTFSGYYLVDAPENAGFYGR